MAKLQYERVNGEAGWQNLPSLDTPINKQNLDHMDAGIKQVSDKVEELSAYELIAEGYAVGTENGKPVSEGSEFYENNSKYYSEKSKESAESIGNVEERVKESEENAKAYSDECKAIAETFDRALIFMGSLTYDDWKSTIASIDLKTGYEWNITTPFVTDDTFLDGAGLECEAGTNVAYANSGLWDIFGGASGGSKIQQKDFAYYLEHKEEIDASTDPYIITMGEGTAVIGMYILNQADYNARKEFYDTCGAFILIRDAEGVGAEGIRYKDTNVESAIDTISANLAQMKLSKTLGAVNTSAYGSIALNVGMEFAIDSVVLPTPLMVAFPFNNGIQWYALIRANDLNYVIATNKDIPAGTIVRYHRVV